MADVLHDRCVWDGGLIVACAPWDVMEAVQRHQATPEHIAARRRVQKVEDNRIRRARTKREVEAVRMARECRMAA